MPNYAARDDVRLDADRPDGGVRDLLADAPVAFLYGRDTRARTRRTTKGKWMKNGSWAPTPRLDDDDDSDHSGRSADEQARYERRMMDATRASQVPRILLPGLVSGGTPNAFLNGRRAITVTGAYPKFDFVVRDLGICVGPPALLVAMGYSGKTFFAQDLAVCAATERLFLDAHAVKPGKVLHLDYDQGTEQTLVRYRRLIAGRELDDSALRHSIDLVRPVMKLDSPDAEWQLREASRGYSLCIIDALRPAISLDENDSRVREPITMLGRVSEETRCAFILIHHTGKSEGGDPRMRGRGSSAIFDAAGTVLNLQRSGSGEDFTYELTQTKSRTGQFSGTATYRLDDVGDWVEAINATAGIRLAPMKTEADEDRDERRIIDALRRHDQLSRKDLEEEVAMKAKRFGAAIKRLTAEPNARVASKKVGKSMLYSLTEAFRAGWEQPPQGGAVRADSSQERT